MTSSYADAAAGARDYAKLVPELRSLQAAVKGLEDAIAAVTCGPTGATRPGVFLFELLSGVKINKDTVFEVLHMLDAAVDLLDDDTVGQMRRRAAPRPVFAICQFCLRRPLLRPTHDASVETQLQMPADSVLAPLC